MSAPQFTRPRRWKIYLRLGRVSNLPTVWTNCLAGTILAGGKVEAENLAPLLASLSFFYTGGMFLNDAFDHRYDRDFRPERPIPSGQIGHGEVFVAGFAFKGEPETNDMRGSPTLDHDPPPAPHPPTSTRVANPPKPSTCGTPTSSTSCVWLRNRRARTACGRSPWSRPTTRAGADCAGSPATTTTTPPATNGNGRRTASCTRGGNARPSPVEQRPGGQTGPATQTPTLGARQLQPQHQ